MEIKRDHNSYDLFSVLENYFTLYYLILLKINKPLYFYYST